MKKKVGGKFDYSSISIIFPKRKIEFNSILFPFVDKLKVYKISVEIVAVKRLIATFYKLVIFICSFFFICSPNEVI